MIEKTYIVSPTTTPQGLHVEIEREPFMEWFTFKLSNGHTEDLEPDEARTWFRDRGANMEAVEKALDYAWNFYHAEVYIANPKEPTFSNPRLRPSI